jgi:hypothetical protein
VIRGPFSLSASLDRRRLAAAGPIDQSFIDQSFWAMYQ